MSPTGLCLLYFGTGIIPVLVEEGVTIFWLIYLLCVFNFYIYVEVGADQHSWKRIGVVESDV